MVVLIGSDRTSQRIGVASVVVDVVFFSFTIRNLNYYVCIEIPCNVLIFMCVLNKIFVCLSLSLSVFLMHMFMHICEHVHVHACT